MPVNIVDGDLFDTTAKYICHQVNCQGVMGSGVAKQVREKFPYAYLQYKSLCDKNTHDMKGRVPIRNPLLGEVLMVNTGQKVICNMFAQDRYGYGYGGKQYTDYNAFKKCLLHLKKMIPAGETIAMPYQIGCGLGGGDWPLVLTMIVTVLSDDYNVELWRK